VVFQGPNRYISPSIYVDPMNVPTWNYVVLQLSGRIELVEDDYGIRAILEESVRKFEKANGLTGNLICQQNSLQPSSGRSSALGFILKDASLS